MAQWFEDSGSRSAVIQRMGKKDASSIDVKFKCLGALNDQAVHGHAADFFNTNPTYSVAGVVMLVDSYEVSHLGGDAWEVTAHYESQGYASTDPDPKKRSRQFDTGGGTAKVTVAFSERRYAASGSTAPDMKGAVNVDGDNVSGVDVTVPTLQWSETYDVPSGIVTEGYIKAVAGITGRINDAGFRSFEAEEVLFLGCSGSQQWDEDKGFGPWSLSYKFAASQNATGLTIGPVTGVEKKGWDFLWVVYEDAVDQNTRLKRPKFVYCNQVYRKASFSTLGIG
jgi:hypothetical protein